MSTNLRTTPVKTSPPAQPAFSGVPDAFYDAEFSVNISKKMRVPDRIQLSDGSRNSSDVMEDPAIIAVKKVNDSSNAEWMHVPDRICVAGGESHVSTREPIPELKLEHTMLGKPHDSEHVQLSTPPRTLRIEDTVPNFETMKKLDKALKNVSNNATTNAANDFSKMNESMINEYEDSEISSLNYTQIRRRILQINHRLDSLEIENRRRDKRDLLLYTAGFLLLIFKGLNWIANRNRMNYL